MKLVFGAISCDRELMPPPVIQTVRIFKRPLGSGQTVFTPLEFRDLIKQETLDEELSEGLLCEPRPGPRVNRPNHDIALIRLPTAFTEEELNYQTTNINTICIEHSKKVPFTVKSPLTAYAAGFGLKDNYRTRNDDRAAVGPGLSFIKYTVFQNGAYSVKRPAAPSSERDTLIGYDEDVSSEEQFGLSLDDDEKRDTAEVIF